MPRLPKTRAIVISIEACDDKDYPNCDQQVRVDAGEHGASVFPFGDSFEREAQLQHARREAMKYCRRTELPVFDKTAAAR